MNPLIQLKKATPLFLIPLALACFALLPRAQAATPENLPAPPPDGFYNGFNTAEGFGALFSLGAGTFNTAIGFKALNADTSGGSNTAVGTQALLHNNVGSYNTAIGENALVFNTSGSFNMALGQGALATNTGGSSNTAMGFQALNSNTASENVAVGYQALRSNTAGGRLAGTFGTNADVGPNTAVGAQALANDTTSSANTAVGYQALLNITTGLADTPVTGQSLGGYNTAVGFKALVNASSAGQENDAFGYEALAHLTSGFENVGIGAATLYSVTDGARNTAVGNEAGFSITGNGNTVVGFFAGENVSTASGVIAIGSGGGNTSNTCWIGNIYGKTTVSATTLPVIVSNTGQLGTTSSSRRFKKEIKPMEKASESILALKPVTFHYKSDNTATPQFGLIAEEVAQVNPDLVVRDENGDIYTVRYDAVNAMLLNEFLKEHRRAEEQAQKLQKLEATVAGLVATVKEQAAQIQKVSAQLDMNKLAPQIVVNNQ